MDYQTLRSELLAGSRLPNPTYSTPKISHLIQTCWLADPIERPTFTKIKEQLQQSCEVLSSEADKGTNYYLALLSDSSMRNQYQQIQKCNPMFEKKDEENQGTTAGSSAQTSGSSYPYFEIQSSERTVLTEVNSISTQGGDMLNYVDTMKEYTALGSSMDEQLPCLPKSSKSNRDEGKEEVAIGVDSYNYLHKSKNPSMKEVNDAWESMQSECSLVV